MGNVPGKKVVNADAGDADHVGGNDWDDQIDYLNNVDKTGPVKINTRQYFRSGKYELRNPADTFSYVHVAAALAANRNVNWPLLTADDEPLFKAFVATVTGKTIDIKDNTFAGRYYGSILFKSGSTYYAIKYDGTVISSSATAETVIQAALDQAGTVYFADTGATDWTLSGAFTGFTVPVHTIIKCDAQRGHIKIVVPNGFTGIAFKYTGVLDENVGINGLALAEAGSPAKNWTGIKFELSGTANVSYCNFERISIYNASVGMELETASGGVPFIESNVFRDILFWGCRTGLLIDQGGSGPSNIHRNIFENIIVQMNSDATCTDGFKNIDGTENIFMGCMVWDPQANTLNETNILSTAVNTLIIGGRMTGHVGTFVDLGTKTLVLDAHQRDGRLGFMMRPDHAKEGSWFGRHATNASGILDGNIANVTVGTGTGTLAHDSTGMYRTYDTGATINSIYGMYGSATLVMRLNNAHFKTAIYLNNNTNVRVFAGLTTVVTAPTSVADPLNATEGVGLWFDSAVNANWRRYHNDASGAGVSDDTTVAAATGTLYPVEIFGQNDSKFRFVFNGVNSNITTDIPASTTALGFKVYMENTTGSARSMRHYYLTIRNDK